jgi:hypothetical protein
MPKSNPTDAWLSGWQALQDQFARAWKDAAGMAGAQPPVHEGFEMWARLAGGGESGNEAVDRMVAGARQMVQMMQSGLAAAAGKAAPAGSDWAAAISSVFGGLGPQDNPMRDALRQAMGQGSRGFEHLFADFAAAAAPFRQDLKSLLHVPAFGYARESQERQQRFALALDDYRARLDAYNQLMLDASRRALEKVESKLAEHSEPGRQLKSFRALYDLWIDAAEEGYAEVALSPEFRAAYGALVNAQMAVRRHVQQEIERAGGALGMPTRGELDAVHRKLAEMKRRLADVEHAAALAQAGPAPTEAVDAPVVPATGSAADPVAKAKPKPKPKRRATAPRKLAPKAAAPKRLTRTTPAPAPAATPRSAPVAAARGAVKPPAKPTKAAASRATRPRLRVVGGTGVAAPPQPARAKPAPPGGSFAERLAALRKASKPAKGGR